MKTLYTKFRFDFTSLINFLKNLPTASSYAIHR